MTKKTINIVLIVIVLAIWGKISYSFFVAPKVKDKDVPINYPVQVKQQKAKKPFRLKDVYRDPFLGVLVKHVVKLKTTTQAKQDIHKAKSKLSLPKMKYYGYVKNKRTGKTLLMIKINGKMERVHLRTHYKGIFFKRIVKDTLFVSFDKKNIKLYIH